MRFSKSLVTLASLVAMLCLPVAANAGSLKISISDGTNLVQVTDGLAGDWSPNQGQVFTLSTGVFSITGLGSSTPYSGNDMMANLHLDSTFVAQQAGSVVLTLEDTGYFVGAGPDKFPQLLSKLSAVFSPIPGGGGASSTVSAVTKLTNSNGVTTVLDLGTSGFDNAATPWFDGTLASSGYADFVSAGPYSLFSQVTINFTGAGIGSFNFDNSVPVPEPGTLILFGSGLVGLARMARRRRAQAHS